MKTFTRTQSPAARLEFLETALAPQIKDAEQQAAAQAAAKRAEVIASRADELAAIDAEREKLEKAHAKIGASLDEATRRFRVLQDEAIRSSLDLRGANFRRDLVEGRYSRVLGPLGGDAVATALYRVKWLANVARDHLGHVPAPAMLKRHERPIDFRALDWNPAELAEVTGRALRTVEPLALSVASPAEIEATCEAELAKCYAAAGPGLLASAPWATVTSYGVQ